MYLAYDPHLQRDVALKVPGRKRLSSVTSLDAFLQEARAAARFKHPGLVVVHDVQQDGDDVYIVQEYIDGQDLSHWARDNIQSPERIVALIKEVVEAVGFAHQHDLVHRDLKPANLLVDRQGHPHVADFGLALNESVQRLRKGEVCGTPAYMSPEQVRGLTHVLDGRSDLWSIGVILYELLTGRRPFGGASHADVFEEVKRRDPKPPRQIKPEIPAELERICLKCLAKRQTDRYASAAELLEDLEAWSRQPSTVVASLDLLANRPLTLPARERHRVRSRLVLRRPPAIRSPTNSKSCVSCPRACVRSTSMTRTSSWNCCRAREIVTDCPRAFGSGNCGSNRRIRTRRFGSA